jgi:hypothetical protein
MNRLDALGELIERSPRGLTKFLTEVALDSDIELDVRLSAVGALGDMEDDPNAVDGLVAALRAPDQPVVRRAAQRLGVVGDSENLAALKEVRSGNRATQQAVRFAKQLISYRNRLGEYRVTLPPRRVRPDADTALVVDVSELRGGDLRAVEARISEPVLGVQLTTQGARKLTCAGNVLNVLASHDLTDTGPEWLLEGQGASGAVLERNPETGAFFASHVILTEPLRGRELAIHVVRSSGTVVMSGRGVMSDAEIRFDLATIPTPHLPPTSVVGLYSSQRGIEFERILSEPRLSSAQMRMVRAPSRQTGPVG